jgi:hypothetical protein
LKGGISSVYLYDFKNAKKLLHKIQQINFFT